MNPISLSRRSRVCLGSAREKTDVRIRERQLSRQYWDPFWKWPPPSTRTQSPLPSLALALQPPFPSMPRDDKPRPTRKNAEAKSCAGSTVTVHWSVYMMG
ncbi:hypothetical protein B296_00002965 [Ensete ventricosum]|uniref:Uncharacterized protein n=1 Tax=Ensete ventricosum TaxID=4639 RepID=A0A427BAT9_ENSVE|nr:hypothetical protein B296_00002965 [Ensete ventricosum]